MNYNSRSEVTSSSTSGHQSHESLESESESPVTEYEPSQNDIATNANKSFLLRLFESTLFDMSMAITYLFNSKEPGVQSYIGELRQVLFTKLNF